MKFIAELAILCALLANPERYRYIVKCAETECQGMDSKDRNRYLNGKNINKARKIAAQLMRVKSTAIATDAELEARGVGAW